MVGKNNYKLKREKASNKFYRYSIKRLSVGVASVAVSAGFLFAGRDAVQVKAAEVLDEGENALTQEIDSSDGTSPAVEESDVNPAPGTLSEAVEEVQEVVEQEVSEERSEAVEAPAPEVAGEPAGEVEVTEEVSEDTEEPAQEALEDSVEEAQTSQEVEVIEDQVVETENDTAATQSIEANEPSEETVVEEKVSGSTSDGRVKGLNKTNPNSSLGVEDKTHFVRSSELGRVQNVTTNDLGVRRSNWLSTDSRPEAMRQYNESLKANAVREPLTATMDGRTGVRAADMNNNVAFYQAAPNQGQNVNDKVNFSNIDLKIFDARTNQEKTGRYSDGATNLGRDTYQKLGYDYLTIYADFTVANDVKAGDYFDIDLGESLYLGSLYENSTLQLNGPAAGTILAEGHYEGYPSNNNVIRMVFTDVVDQYNNISGSFIVGVGPKEEVVTDQDTPHEFSFSLAGQEYSETLKVNYDLHEDRLVNGSPLRIPTEDGKWQYVTYLNYPRSNFPNGWDNSGVPLAPRLTFKDENNTLDMDELSYRVYTVDFGYNLSDFSDGMFIDVANPPQGLTDATREVNEVRGGLVSGLLGGLFGTSSNEKTIILGSDRSRGNREVNLLSGQQLVVVWQVPDEGGAKSISVTVEQPIPNGAGGYARKSYSEGPAVERSVSTGSVDAIPAPQEEPGTFVETHTYITINAAGEVVEQDSVTKDPVSGGSEDTYSTQAETRDGYILTQVVSSGEAQANFNQSGAQATGNFVPGQRLQVDYTYIRRLEPELPAEEGLGTFTETHIYNYYDQNGILINSDRQTGQRIEDEAGAEYTTKQVPRDGYTLIRVTGTNGAKYNEDGSSATGEIVGDVDQAVGYVYEYRPEEEKELYEMTVEDKSYPTKFELYQGSENWVGIREKQPGQDGRVRVLYRHVNPDDTPDFTPTNFVNIRGQYYEEVSREVIQEAIPQIFEYSPRRIVETIRHADGTIELVYNDDSRDIIPPAPRDTLVPIVETYRDSGPLDPDLALEYYNNPGSYTGETRPGTWVIVKNPTGNYIDGAPEYNNEIRFIPDSIDGQDGEDGLDGVSPTVTTERTTVTDPETGEQVSGTNVTVVNRTRNPETGEIEESEPVTTFIPDGKDGEDGEDGKDGVDGTDGRDGNYVELVDNDDGTYDIIVRDGETEDIIGRETVRNGEDGLDGVSPTVTTERTTVTDPETGEQVSGTNVTVVNRTRNPETGEIEESEPVTTFIPDGKDGVDGEDGVDGTDGRDGNYVELVDNEDGTYDIIVLDGETEEIISRETVRNGEGGLDGVSPTVTTERTTVTDPETGEQVSGTNVTVVNRTRNPETGEIEESEPVTTFIPDGKDGEDGLDGVSPTVTAERTTVTDPETGEQVSGTNVTVINRTRNPETGEIEESEPVTTFIPDGKDGEDGEDGQDGADGQDGRDGNYVELVDNDDGTYDIIVRDGETEDIIGRETVRNGEDGLDGVSPTVTTERTTVTDPETGEQVSGTNVTVVNRTRNPETGEIEESEPVITFIPDGKDGEDGEDGKDGVDGTDGRDGNYVELADNDDGTYDIIVRDGETEDIIGRETIRNGQDGLDGVSPTVTTERTTVTDPETGEQVSGTNVTVVNRTRNPETGEIEESEPVTTFIPDGKDGEDGEDGKDGVDGTDGRDGNYVELADNDDGTYDIIVRDGETEEIISRETVRDGQDGRDGIDGNSAVIENVTDDGFELVIRDSEGNEISRERVTHGRDGADGNDGTDGRDGNYVEVTDNGDGTYVLIVRDGETGEEISSVTVRDGQDGRDGIDGNSAVIENVTDDGFELVIRDSEGNEISRERVTHGRDGADGNDGTDGRDGNYVEVTDNGDGTYVLIVRNGETGEEISSVTVRDGQDGNDGADGRDGNYVEVEDNGDGTYDIITRNGETHEEINRVTVRDGQDGERGEQGEPGQDGRDGQDGRSVTAQTERGELGGRTGTWVNIYEVNPYGTRGALLDREFIFDGEDGRSVTAQTERGEQDGRLGTWVRIYEVNSDGSQGALIDQEFVFDGQDGQDGKSVTVSTERGDHAGHPGTWVIVRDRDTGVELDREFIFDGENGQVPTILTEEITDRDGNVIGVQITVTSPEGDVTTHTIYHGRDGQDGNDGQSVKVRDNGEGSFTIIAVGTDGTETEIGTIRDGRDGKDGQDGQDGKSVTVLENEDGSYSLVETDPETGEERVVGTVRDGRDGRTPEVLPVFDGSGNRIGVEIILVDPEGNIVSREFVYDGRPGADGEDGRGITEAIINRDGELILIYNDGTSENVGLVVGQDGRDGVDGQDGQDGRDGKSVSVREVSEGVYEIVEYDPNTDTERVVGIIRDGEDGISAEARPIFDGEGNQIGVEIIVTAGDGEEIRREVVMNGRDGRGIRETLINQDGELIFIYTDGTIENVGSVVGQDGRDGRDGSAAGNINIDNDNVNTNEQGDIVITLPDREPIVIPNPENQANPIQNIRIDGDGNLIFELTGGRTINAGYLGGLQDKAETPGDDEDVFDSETATYSIEEVAEGIQITVYNVDGTVETHLIRNGENGERVRIVSRSTDEHGNVRLVFSDGSEILISGFEAARLETSDDVNVNVTIDVIKEGSGSQLDRVLVNAMLDNREHLILTYSNGETVDLGRVAGASDRTVVSTIVNSDNELILVYNDGTIQNAGSINVKDGQDGKSAYELWLEAGNTGTLEDFLDSLKADSSQETKVVKSIEVNVDGDLVVNFTDNSSQVIYHYPAQGDSSANGIKDARVDAEGNLIIVLDDGTQINAGNVRGDQGEPGQDGRGIANIRIDNNGNVIVVYTDFSVNIIGQLDVKEESEDSTNTPDDGDSDETETSDNGADDSSSTRTPGGNDETEESGDGDSNASETSDNGEDDSSSTRTPGGNDETEESGDGDSNTTETSDNGEDDSSSTRTPGGNDETEESGDGDSDETETPEDDGSSETPDENGDDTPDQPDDDGETEELDDGDSNETETSDNSESDSSSTRTPGGNDETEESGDGDSNTTETSDNGEDDSSSTRTPGGNDETEELGDGDSDETDNLEDGGSSETPEDGDDNTPNSPEVPGVMEEELTYTKAGFPGNPRSSDWRFVASPAASASHGYSGQVGDERLPDTATLTWLLGLAGASSLLGGSALAIKDRKRK